MTVAAAALTDRAAPPPSSAAARSGNVVRLDDRHQRRRRIVGRVVAAASWGVCTGTLDGGVSRRIHWHWLVRCVCCGQTQPDTAFHAGRR